MSLRHCLGRPCPQPLTSVTPPRRFSLPPRSSPATLRSLSSRVSSPPTCGLFCCTLRPRPDSVTIFEIPAASRHAGRRCPDTLRKPAGTDESAAISAGMTAASAEIQPGTAAMAAASAVPDLTSFQSTAFIAAEVDANPAGTGASSATLHLTCFASHRSPSPG